MVGCMLAIWRERRSGFAHVGEQSLEPTVSRAVLCRETSVWEDVYLAKACRSISHRKGSSDVAMCALGRGRSRKAEEDSSPDVLRRPFGDPILSTSAHSADLAEEPPTAGEESVAGLHVRGSGPGDTALRQRDEVRVLDFPGETPQLQDGS